mmetsp:Transcript_79347/g.155258  ORF Transcript_79347/g.155258 Transcript_79347/m.155258 type:complete len:115 (+) Transcript_79347:229-573(+)
MQGALASALCAAWPSCFSSKGMGRPSRDAQLTHSVPTGACTGGQGRSCGWQGWGRGESGSGIGGGGVSGDSANGGGGDSGNGGGGGDSREGSMGNDNGAGGGGGGSDGASDCTR